jgi:predicted glycosyltransferase
MNREAAALGVPAATIYAGRWAAIDEELVKEGRLRRISTREDLQQLPIEKKRHLNRCRAVQLRGEIVDFILGE